MIKKNSGKLVVLGGGPGGYTAAFLAADQGWDVTLVDETPKPGGVCLHRGCIPSKALLHVAQVLTEARDAVDFGIRFDSPGIDLEKLRAWKNGIVDRMVSGLASVGKARNVRWVEGRAVFRDSHTLQIAGGEELSFDRCVIAVGSRPLLPPVFRQVEGLMDSTRALDLPEIPKRLLVVGGGYIGLELGTVYAALGSRVTLVEMMDRLLPGVDADLVRPLATRLKNQFESIHLNTQVKSITRAEERFQVHCSGTGGEETGGEFDGVLVAVGRAPNTADLGLERTRVEMDEKGFLRTDAGFRTADPAIWAIGDVIGGAQLAHKASHEAKILVESLGSGDEVSGSSPAIIPAVVFTLPEIAWCGLTETDARKENRSVNVARLPWSISGRAQTQSRGEGVTKLLIDPETEAILGVGIAGMGAGDLISEGVLAMQMGATVRDLARAIHPHPTLSETLMEAAEVALGISPHIYKKPRTPSTRPD